MAVESKQGSDGTGASKPPNGSVRHSEPAIASGSSPSVPKRTSRHSALMKAASALPTVESSLEEFIAKANQTLVDVGGWGAADQAAKAAEEKRREQDALRWKQAEQQMRESEARELALRPKLDGLQGKLAEAEARAAIAGTTSPADRRRHARGLKQQI